VRVTVERSEIDGRIEAPSSKSMTHRAIICSALAQGKSRVNRPLVSDDTDATLRVVQSIGAIVEKNKGSWIIEGGELNPPEEDLHCGESGTTLRLMTAVCALFRGTSVLKGGPSLSGRPVEPLLDALRQLGVQCESNDGYPPVNVHGKGGIDGGEVSIRGDISSQFVSALLLVAPYARKQLKVKITTRLESAPYVGMTMDGDAGGEAGVRPYRIRCRGGLVLGILHAGGGGSSGEGVRGEPPPGEQAGRFGNSRGPGGDGC
jgi:3-phosphoshikimate 1-carboxyvinyltransferase